MVTNEQRLPGLVPSPVRHPGPCATGRTGGQDGQPGQGNPAYPALAARPRLLSYGGQWATLIAFLVALDALAVFASLTLAYSARFTSGLLAYSSPYNPSAYHRFTLVSVPIWLALFLVFGLYRRDVLLGGVAEYEGIIRACAVGILAIITVSFFWRNAVLLSRGWLLLAMGFSCLVLTAERFLFRRIAYIFRRRGWLTARVLIVGANDQGMAIAEQWRASPSSGMAVVGFVDDFKPVGSTVTDGLQVLGRPSALDAVARQTRAHEVILVTGAVAWETFEEIITGVSHRNGYTLRLSPGFYELLSSGVAVTNKTFVPLLTVDAGRLVGVDSVLKALLDYGLGVPLLVLASPVMAAIALSLRMGSRAAPLLERVPALGKHGAVFSLLRFRSRQTSQDGQKGLEDATSRLPARSGGATRARVARGSGQDALAQRGLDKLPQLFNVVVGQMSLVGPRPRLRDELETDPLALHNLQSVKPGMLGPWLLTQNLMSKDEIRDELHYIRNWTIWLDLQILAQAIQLVFSASRRN